MQGPGRVGATVAGRVANCFAGGVEDHFGGEGREVARLAFRFSVNVPDDVVEGVLEFFVHRLPQRSDQAEPGDFGRGCGWHLAQKIRELMVGVGEGSQETRRVSETRRVLAVEAEHGRVKRGQNVVVNDAPGTPVKQLALGQALALQGHEPPGQFGAGLGVYQPLAAGAGDFDFLLRVESAVRFFAQQQNANQTMLAPQRHGPQQAAVFSRVQRQAH